MRYFEKFGGTKVKLPAKLTIEDKLFALIGGIVSLILMGYFTESFDNLFIMSLFASSAVFLFGIPDSSYSQPKNLILGHLFSAYVALLIFDISGHEWSGLLLAVLTASLIMIITKTVHPPAILNPLVIYAINANFEYMIEPLFLGMIILLLVSLFYNNLHSNVSYPQYWR